MTVNLVKLAKFIDAAITMNRGDTVIFDMLDTDERRALIMDFVKRNLSSDEFVKCHYAANAGETFVRPLNGLTVLQSDYKIDVIKLVRNETGLGLKEAKDFVEGREHSFTSSQYERLTSLLGTAVQRF